MNKNSAKVFTYELKKCVLPLLALLAAFFIVVVRVLFALPVCAESVVVYDKVVSIGGYVFYGLTLAVLGYRTFSMRKLYEKIRIPRTKLFWVRILFAFALSFVYITLFILVGSTLLDIYQAQGMENIHVIAQKTLFAFQGKSGWYGLFGVSVGVSATMTYATVAFIHNVVCSREKMSLKVVWIIVFVFTICLVVFAVALSATLPNIGFGSIEPFAVPIPQGYITWNEFLIYDRPFHPTWRDFTLPHDLRILRYDLCWDITNIWKLLGAAFIVVFSFLSIEFLYRDENASYEYVSQEKFSKKTKTRGQVCD